MTSIRRLGWTALALFALAGCDSSTGTSKTPTPPPKIDSEAITEGNKTPIPPTPPKGTPKIDSAAIDPVKPDEPKKEADAKLSDEEIAAIMKLPAEDQKIALAQMICPVSNEHLGVGNMGAPLKQVVDGKTFFLCCESCEKDVKADPKGVLAKLKK